jgi:hypothetical protein
MEHLRKYFQVAIADKLHELGIRLEMWEVHCVSVKKSYGLKECLDALIRLRLRDANVYFLGGPPKEHLVGGYELTRGRVHERRQILCNRWIIGGSRLPRQKTQNYYPSPSPLASKKTRVCSSRPHHISLASHYDAKHRDPMAGIHKVLADGRL